MGMNFKIDLRMKGLWSQGNGGIGGGRDGKNTQEADELRSGSNTFASENSLVDMWVNVSFVKGWVCPGCSGIKHMQSLQS